MGARPTHAQSLHSWLAHIPGLKVVMPFSPYDAKGLLISSVPDSNPAVFIEHRWLHQSQFVPDGEYTVDIGKANQKRGKRCINSGFIINGCRGVKGGGYLDGKIWNFS